MEFWRLTLDRSVSSYELDFYQSIDSSEMIVAAASEEEARRLAYQESSAAWRLNQTASSCTRLTPPLKPIVVPANRPPLD